MDFLNQRQLSVYQGGSSHLPGDAKGVNPIIPALNLKRGYGKGLPIERPLSVNEFEQNFVDLADGINSLNNNLNDAINQVSSVDVGSPIAKIASFSGLNLNSNREFTRIPFDGEGIYVITDIVISNVSGIVQNASGGSFLAADPFSYSGLFDKKDKRAGGRVSEKARPSIVIAITNDGSLMRTTTQYKSSDMLVEGEPNSNRGQGLQAFSTGASFINTKVGGASSLAGQAKGVESDKNLASTSSTGGISLVSNMLVANELFFSLDTLEGSEITCDVYVFGYKIAEVGTLNVLPEVTTTTTTTGQAYYSTLFSNTDSKFLDQIQRSSVKYGDKIGVDFGSFASSPYLYHLGEIGVGKTLYLSAKNGSYYSLSSIDGSSFTLIDEAGVYVDVNGGIVTDIYFTTTTTTTRSLTPVVYLESANWVAEAESELGPIWSDIQKNYNGILRNGTSYTNNVMVFDGVDDFVDMSTIPDSFWNAGPWSVSAWVKFNSLDRPLYNDSGIVGHGQSGNGMGLQLGERQGKPMFAFWNNDLQGNTKLSKDVWYNIVFTYDNATGQKKIYVNGQFDTSGSGSYSGYGSNTQFGNQPFGGNRQLDGSLDSIKLFDVVLTDSEVSKLYEDGMVQPTTTTTTTESLVDKIYTFQWDLISNQSEAQHSLDHALSTNAQTEPTYFWNGIFNVVVNGNFAVGKEVYFIDGDGFKRLFSSDQDVVMYFDIASYENPDYCITIESGIITNIGSAVVDAIKYVDLYTEPTYYVYEFPSAIISGDRYAEMFDKERITNWDGTYRIVATNFSEKAHAYYIGTDGDKHLIPFSMLIVDGCDIRLQWSMFTVINGVNNIEFTSITPFVVIPTTTTTTTVFEPYNSITAGSTVTQTVNTRLIKSKEFIFDFNNSIFELLTGNTDHVIMAIVEDSSVTEGDNINTLFINNVGYSIGRALSVENGPSSLIPETNPDSMWIRGINGISKYVPSQSGTLVEQPLLASTDVIKFVITQVSTNENGDDVYTYITDTLSSQSFVYGDLGI